MYFLLGIWDCMSNQQVVDYIIDGVKNEKTLDKICEDIMDSCLANDSTSNGLGYDNMSIMIIGVLHDKSEKEWYDWIREKHNNSNEMNKEKDTSPS